jgi:predicted MFS family arabinose efflux permease
MVTRKQLAVALTLLASINAFGFIDRVMIALVAEKIKAEFLVTDLQIGLLGGTAFAIINMLASIPIARAAERFKRSHVMAAFLFLASLFTALAGATSSFFQLLLCRFGMATGNAATEAPAHSMISDMYPPEKRASAISLFMLGVPVAALLGSFLGGTIAEQFGWRRTFLFFGGMGVVIALLCYVCLQEPVRRSSLEGDTRTMGTIQVLRLLLASASLCYLVIAVSFISLGSFGVNTFLPAFFSRNHGLDAGQAGLMFGLISGFGSLGGTLLGGYGSEYMARRDPRWLLWFPALGLLLGAPVFLFGLLNNSLLISIPAMLIGSFSFYTAMGPAIATLHGQLDSYSRATGSALFLLIMHLVGQGLGPPLVGAVSDAMSSSVYSGSSFIVDCTGAPAHVVGPACAQAAAAGLKYAIAFFTIFFMLGGLLLFLAVRSSQKAAPARTI